MIKKKILVQVPYYWKTKNENRRFELGSVEIWPEKDGFVQEFHGVYRRSRIYYNRNVNFTGYEKIGVWKEKSGYTYFGALNYGKYPMINNLATDETISLKRSGWGRRVVGEKNLFTYWVRNGVFSYNDVTDLSFEDGKYTGWVSMEQPHGFGKWQNETNTKTFEGQWFNGKRHGQGVTRYEPKKITIKGEYQYGFLHGYAEKTHETAEGTYIYKTFNHLGHPFYGIFFKDDQLLYKGGVRMFRVQGENTRPISHGLSEFPGGFFQKAKKVETAEFGVTTSKKNKLKKQLRFIAFESFQYKISLKSKKNIGRGGTFKSQYYLNDKDNVSSKIAHGLGTFTNEHGMTFEGTFKNGEIYKGKSVWNDNNKRYEEEGIFENGRLKSGVVSGPNYSFKSIDDGRFEKGLYLHGFGTLTENGVEYKGYFREGLKHGFNEGMTELYLYGKKVDYEPKQIQLKFKNQTMKYIGESLTLETAKVGGVKAYKETACGYGQITYSNGDTYVGDVVYNVPHGEGIYKWEASGIELMSQNWDDGKLDSSRNKNVFKNVTEKDENLVPYDIFHDSIKYPLNDPKSRRLYEGFVDGEIKARLGSVRDLSQNGLEIQLVDPDGKLFYRPKDNNNLLEIKTYIGAFERGVYHSNNATVEYGNGIRCQGNFVAGQLHGYCVMEFDDALNFNDKPGATINIEGFFLAGNFITKALYQYVKKILNNTGVTYTDGVLTMFLQYMSKVVKAEVPPPKFNNLPYGEPNYLAALKSQFQKGRESYKMYGKPDTKTVSTRDNNGNKVRDNESKTKFIHQPNTTLKF